MVGERTMKIEGASHVRENETGPAFLISPTAFFQTNVAAAAHLVRLVTNPLRSARRVLDLFSGSGLFSIALASAGAQVVSVEDNRQANRDADANRRLNRIPEDRLRLICSTVEGALPRLLREPFDAVVLDPPREGCGHAGTCRPSSPVWRLVRWYTCRAIPMHSPKSCPPLPTPDMTW